MGTCIGQIFNWDLSSARLVLFILFALFFAFNNEELPKKQRIRLLLSE